MIETFEDFVSNASTRIPVITFIFNFCLSGLLTIPLSWMYVKYGNAISNRRAFSKNFIFMTMTTMLIITIIKSSLALSLGLVGALSIIRFRAAIKEPQELAYLFIAISIGLGFGANQGIITTIALFIIITVIIIMNKFSQKSVENQNLHLTINCIDPSEFKMEKLVNILKENCLSVHINRIDETEEQLEATFLIELFNYEELNLLRKKIRELDDSIRFTFVDELNIF